MNSTPAGRFGVPPFLRTLGGASAFFLFKQRDFVYTGEKRTEVNLYADF